MDVSLRSFPGHKLAPSQKEVLCVGNLFKSMGQINFHSPTSSGSTASSTPIMGHLLAAYKSWHEFQQHIPKTSRYGLGLKIESLFSDSLESIFSASYAGREEKVNYLKNASSKIDLLKFFLTILWETKALDNKKYAELSEKLVEIGRMLGGWQRKIALQENPAGTAGK